LKKDFSFGIVPVCKRGNEYHVFIIKHIGGHWSFPKGHPEEGETPIETAKRELKEETGLEVSNILPETKLEENYMFQLEGEKIQKKVVYFIGVVKEPDEVVIDLSELIEGKWANLNEAPMHLTYEEAKRICRQTAQLLIRKKEG